MENNEVCNLLGHCFFEEKLAKSISLFIKEHDLENDYETDMQFWKIPNSITNKPVPSYFIPITAGNY